MLQISSARTLSKSLLSLLLAIWHKELPDMFSQSIDLGYGGGCIIVHFLCKDM